MYDGVRSLRHSNGRHLVTVYNEPGNNYDDPRTQGATIAFNLTRSDGSWISHHDVEKKADDRDIYLRSGGLCNAGGIATYLDIKPWEFKRNYSAGFRCGADGMEVMSGKPTGVVRASLGAMSTVADVDIFISFLAETFLPSAEAQQSPPTSLAYRPVNSPSNHMYHLSAQMAVPPIPSPAPQNHSAHRRKDVPPSGSPQLMSYLQRNEVAGSTPSLDISRTVHQTQYGQFYTQRPQTASSSVTLADQSHYQQRAGSIETYHQPDSMSLFERKQIWDMELRAAEGGVYMRDGVDAMKLKKRSLWRRAKKVEA